MNNVKNFSSKIPNAVLSCILVLCCLFGMFSLSGCDGERSAVYNVTPPTVTVDTETVASNGNYELLWNDDLKCVSLKSVASGEIWSPIPYEYQLEGGTSANVNSTLNITVSNQESMEWSPVRGYVDAYQNGRIFAESTDNGIKVTYCFDNYEIAIPVVYTLRNDSVEISIDPNEIVESGNKFVLLSVSVAPFMCSARNADEGSYMFIPVGSGSLMYAQERIGTERSWSGAVFGEDLARNVPRTLCDDEKVTMPVFGVKDADKSMLAIIESGASSAVIEAEAGNPRTGYSTVYPTFYVRGYDIFEQSKKLDLKRVSDSLSEQTLKIGYYPLKSGDGYVQMANRYRDYLKSENNYSVSKASDSVYAVELLGGVTVTSSFAGVPVKKDVSMTTFDEALEILKELCEKIGVMPTTVLSGFGDGGITLGKLGGGFDVSSVSGGKAQLSDLTEYCNDKELNLFFDYDIVRYNASSSGFSYINDVAKTAILKKAQCYFSQGAFRAFSDDWTYRLVKRSFLSKATDSALKSSNDLGVSGISLSTLSSIAYSDYSDSLYYTKGNIETDVSELFARVRNSEKLVSGTSANSYAAALADVVFDSPVDNGEYDTLDDSIPFYQMVFGFDRSLYTSAINISENPKKTVMLAASSGMGLGFSLIANYDVNFEESQVEKLYGMLFEDNVELISDLVSEYAELYSAVSNSRINSYEFAGDGITKTVFENGVTVFANHNDYETECEVGSLEAYGYCAIY